MKDLGLYHPTHTQSGIALATALIFLVVITLLGLVAVRSSTIELQLASNAQSGVEALQTAQAVVDAVIQNPANLPVNQNLEQMRCYGSAEKCESPELVLPTPDGEPSSTVSDQCDPNAGPFQTGIYAEVKRLPPAQAPVPAALLTSMDKFHTVRFSVRGQYACGKAGLGAADIEQGIMKLVPNLSRIN